MVQLHIIIRDSTIIVDIHIMLMAIEHIVLGIMAIEHITIITSLITILYMTINTLTLVPILMNHYSSQDVNY